MTRFELVFLVTLACCASLAASSRAPDRPSSLNCTYTGYVRFGNAPEDRAFSEIKSQEQDTSSFVISDLGKKECKLKETNTGLELTLKEMYENAQGTFFMGSYGLAFRLYVINWKIKKVYVYSIVNFSDGFSTSLISTSNCK